MKTFHDAYAGFTALEFTQRSGRTVATRREYRGQSRISAQIPLNEEATPCYFLITMGGGLVEGEEYRNEIACRPGTHAVVTSQAPTYVFKCTDGRTTHQIFDVKVDSGAALELLPDDVIPYGDARYSQLADVDVAEGGSLLFTDGVTSGWDQSGDDFQYTFAHMVAHIRYNGELVYNDNLILDPSVYEMGGLGLYDGARDYSSFVGVDGRIDDAFVADLQNYAKELAGSETANDIASGDGPIIGITRLQGPAFVLRVLGGSTSENKKVTLRFVDYVRGKLYDLPRLDLRKDVAFTK